MTYIDIVIQVLSSVFNIVLPFGFTFGMLVVFIFSIPLIVKLLKKIF